MACPLDTVSVKPGTPHSMLALPSLSLLKRALQPVTRCTAGLLLSRLHLHGRLRCSYVTKAAPVLATPSSLSLSIKSPACRTVSGAGQLQVLLPHLCAS